VSVRFDKGAAATSDRNDEILITGKVESMTQVVIVRAGFSLSTFAMVLIQRNSGLAHRNKPTAGREVAALKIVVVGAGSSHHQNKMRLT
jgi:hypothetical protein